MRQISKFLAREDNLTIGTEGSGYVEGYASIFNVVDLQGEVVLAGAFKRTIKERISAGKVFLMSKHMSEGGGTYETVGVISEGREDNVGFWIHADFFDTPEAQAVRVKTCNKISKFGFSIGGAARIEPRKVDGMIVTALTEVKLNEVTVTPFPACDDARVVVAKSGVADTETTSRNDDADDDPGASTPAITEPPAPIPPDADAVLTDVAKTQAWLVNFQLEVALMEIAK